MRYGFVYETTNNINGKKYIGKCATTVNDRDLYLGSGVDLRADIKKYGRDNFTRVILEYADSEEELQELEISYLTKADIPNSKYYNKRITHGGGERYSRMSDSTLQAKLKSLSDHSTGENNPMYGKIKGDNVLESISKANSKEIVVDGKTYPSITQASKELGIGVTTLSNRLDSHNFPTYHRVHPKRKVSSKETTNKRKRVSIEGVIYDSIKEASEALECSTTKVRLRCKAEWCEDWLFI